MTRAELLQTAKPILFSSEMVRAILDGRKTVTRRVIKPQPKNRIAYCFAGYKCGTWGYPSEDAYKYWGEEFKRTEQLTADEGERRWTPLCHTDDILYVRETWVPMIDYTPCGRIINTYAYKADDEKYFHGITMNIPVTGWHPSIHMPKEAARIFLRVTDVRVERLQDITEKETLKEGISDEPLIEGSSEKFSALWQFPHIWDSTIPKKNRELYGWDANPWVWVIEFERVEAQE